MTHTEMQERFKAYTQESTRFIFGDWLDMDWAGHTHDADGANRCVHCQLQPIIALTCNSHAYTFPCPVCEADSGEACTRFPNGVAPWSGNLHVDRITRSQATA